MWRHYCLSEKVELSVAFGEACNWCGCVESKLQRGSIWQTLIERAAQ